MVNATGMSATYMQCGDCLDWYPFGQSHICGDPAAPTDAPRPRGKMKSGKSWREEVREMIDADRVNAIKALGEMLEAALSGLAAPRPWYVNLWRKVMR